MNNNDPSATLTGLETIRGGTRVCAVIGDPIEHTISPIIHNAAFRSLDMDFVYVAFQVRGNELERAIKGMTALEIVGLNVTRPHKTSVMRFLDAVEGTARRIGAVNTIVRSGNKLRGYNTDGQAAMEVLSKMSGPLSGKKVVILGAGGAARSIAYYLSKTVNEMSILNRTRAKASRLAREVMTYSGIRCRADPLNTTCLREEAAHGDIIVNTLPVDVFPIFAETLIQESLIRTGMVVFDANYHQTDDFLPRAQQAGAKVSDGLEMLVGQAALSFELWTGRTAPIDTMREAALGARRARAR